MTWLCAVAYLVAGFGWALVVAYIEGLDGTRYSLVGKHPGWALAVIVIWPLVALAIVLTPIGWAFRWAYDLGLKHRKESRGE